jgi:hypothetical protein
VEPQRFRARRILPPVHQDLGHEDLLQHDHRRTTLDNAEEDVLTMKNGAMPAMSGLVM